MGTVHVSIRHDDDFVIAQLGGVKLFADAGAQRHDDRLKLIVAVNLVCTGLFHIQHLTPQRQDGLETGVTALGCGAACGVTLDDVDFCQFGVILIAVAELIGHGRAAQSGFAANGLSRLTGGLTGTVGGEGLVQNHAANLRILLQEGIQLFGNNVVDQRADLAVAQLGLGLALKLSLGQLYGNHTGQTLSAVFTGDLLVIFQHLDLTAVSVQNRGQGTLEALLMHTAFRSMDIVGEREDGLVITVVILQGDLGHAVILLAGHVDHIVVEGILALIEPGDEFTDTALIAHGVIAIFFVLLRGSQTVIGNGDAQTGIQEGLLPHTGMERIVVIHQILKHLRIRLKGNGGTGMVCFAHDGHLLHHMAAGELHLMDFSVTVYLYLQPLTQSVDNGSAHAVETAGYLVTAAAELAAGMQNGINHFQSRLAGLGLNIHRDTTAIVHNGDGIALVDDDLDLRTVAGQRLIDGVIHDLIHQMVQTAGRRGADVHTWALAHRFQTLQNLNFRSVILGFHIYRRGS